MVFIRLILAVAGFKVSIRLARMKGQGSTRFAISKDRQVGGLSTLEKHNWAQLILLKTVNLPFEWLLSSSLWKRPTTLVMPPSEAPIYLYGQCQKI